METKRICPGCRRPLADDAPQALCPQCLVKAGLGSGVSIDPETKSGQPHFIAPSIEELSGRFPQLEIINFIGQGGMGAVYKARQKQLDRVVALKILPPGISQDPSFAERFSREAKALAKLDHPGIVTIHDFGQAEGLFFFVMEFVDGLNLRQLLQTGRVSPREALAIVPQICDALQYAHDVGIVHRDIKPENILLDRRGRVKVADFGLAKLVGVGNELILESGTADGSGALTEAGKIIGTPNYIAPEQMDHPGEVDHRADIYALGVVLYQMLTGELPGKPIRPPSGKVHIDVRLDEVVLRALEQKPERRYQKASLLKTDVEKIALTPGAAPSTDQRAINEAEWRNPKNWSLGLYFSKRDSRSLWVPRRLRGFGWTINLGHWQGAAFLLGSTVLLVLLLVLGIHSKHNYTPAVQQHAVPNSPKPVLAIPAEKGDIAVYQPAAVFGPIIERSLSIRGNECDFLSFRTGEVLRHSYFDGDQIDSTPPTAFRQWVHEHGLDIGFCASTEKFYGPLGLLALDMGTYIFPYDTVPQHMIPRFRSVTEWQTYNAQHEIQANKPLIGSLAGVTNIWDDLTADQMEGPTNEAPAFFLKEKHFSLWFRSTNLITQPIAFSTRDGVQGLLQITGFTNNPPVLKLRYKLVSHAGSAENNPLQSTGSSTPGIGENSVAEPSIPVEEPSRANPVTAGVAANRSDVGPGDTFELRVRVRIAGGHYIYSTNVIRGPFTATRLTLNLPDGIEALGDWYAPTPTQTKTGDLVYLDSVVFRRQLKVGTKAKPGELPLSCELVYQACSEELCWPPKTIRLPTSVTIRNRTIK